MPFTPTTSRHFRSRCFATNGHALDEGHAHGGSTGFAFVTQWVPHVQFTSTNVSLERKRSRIVFLPRRRRFLALYYLTASSQSFVLVERIVRSGRCSHCRLWRFCSFF